MEILKAIHAFILETEKTMFYKSELREVGIATPTAHDWFKVIEYCQTKMPRIRLMEVHRNLIIEVLEKKEE